MYPEHIAELFEMVGPGMPVTLVHQGVKAGWAGDELYIEVHPNTDVPDEDARPSMAEVVRALIAAVPEGNARLSIDWKRIRENTHRRERSPGRGGEPGNRGGHRSDGIRR